eukprot:Phypoly_transcript_09068.p1 GENE.Phypoly_transcript_09068~~Phypoly_transcript_09068.p1  ORF type:complete len:418 (+),score=44.66 Phypoly_transcript_09068:111-1364(+)
MSQTLDTGDDAAQMFAVQPKTNCPHLGAGLSQGTIAIDLKIPCGGCNDLKENWLCLQCGAVNCSRFVNSHASAHNESTKHPIALSFSDLSFWCYTCDSYIKAPALNLIWTAAYTAKFGEAPPEPTNRGFNPGEDINEYYDSPSILEEKVTKLADYIRESGGRTVAYTGAGVSTSAKIPDYRGPQGYWTLKDQGVAMVPGIKIAQAIPTFTHVSLVQLQKRGVINFVTSTNVDGLHRRAGTAEHEMAELHGNCYKETCTKCKKEYLRTFDVTDEGTLNHLTFRQCEVPGCGGNLRDTIINFGEDLPEGELTKADQRARESTLSLVLGTSMRVSPACHLPLIPIRKDSGRLVIVNLQKTPYDKEADLRIWAPTDVVFSMLMEKLGVPVPNEIAGGYPVARPPPYQPDPAKAAPQKRKRN